MSGDDPKDMTLFWDLAGIRIRWNGSDFKIDTPNPRVTTVWRMGRWDMIKLGARCILSALIP